MKNIITDNINELLNFIIQNQGTNLNCILKDHSLCVEYKLDKQNNVQVDIIFNDIEISSYNLSDIFDNLDKGLFNHQVHLQLNSSYPKIEFANLYKVQPNSRNKLIINYLFTPLSLLEQELLVNIINSILQQYTKTYPYETNLSKYIFNLLTDKHKLDINKNFNCIYQENFWQINLYGNIYIAYFEKSTTNTSIIEINGFYFDEYIFIDLETHLKQNNSLVTIGYNTDYFRYINIIKNNISYMIYQKSANCIQIEYNISNIINEDLIDNLLSYLIDNNRIALFHPIIDTIINPQHINICLINDFGFPIEYLNEIIRQILINIGYQEKYIVFIEYNNIDYNNLDRSHIIYNISETKEINKLKNQLPNTIFISCGLEYDLLSISKQRIIKEFNLRVKQQNINNYITEENYINLSFKLNSDAKYKTLKENLNKCSHEADFFINYHSDRNISLSKYKLRQQLKRIIYLLHGYNYCSPTQDEYMMYMAFAAALRSTDLSRQVGSVITTEYGDIIATGANDIPKNGGGLYFANIEPHTNQVYDNAIGKDYMRGFDSNVIEQNKIMHEIATKLNLTEHQIKELSQTKLKNLTEYGRVVHAEMEALMACARNNTSTRNATLYCTTFPCHNCAKHIIAAGIKRVVYIEPYSKSMAIPFHPDSIIANNIEPNNDNKVKFESFNGVGPRLYLQIFQTKQTRKDSSGKVITSWTPQLIKI